MTTDKANYQKRSEVLEITEIKKMKKNFLSPSFCFCFLPLFAACRRSQAQIKRELNQFFKK